MYPGRTFRIIKKRLKHLFRKTKSYGFNHYVMSNATKFDHVILMDEYATWKIPVKFIIDNGKFMEFSGKGFEKQIFLTLNEIEQFKTEKSNVHYF